VTYERSKAMVEVHELAKAKMSAEMDAAVDRVGKIAEEEKRRRLNLVQRTLYQLMHAELMKAFDMFYDAVFIRKLAAKMSKRRGGLPTLDPLFVSFQRWIHYVDVLRHQRHKTRGDQAEAHLRRSEEEISVLGSQNKELEQKLAEIGTEMEQLEVERQALAESLSLAQEEVAAAVAALQVERSARESRKDAIAARAAYLVSNVRVRVLNFVAHRMDRERARWSLLHWRLRSELARDQVIMSAAEDVRSLNSSFLNPVDRQIEEENMLPMSPQSPTRYFPYSESRVGLDIQTDDHSISSNSTNSSHTLKAPHFIATSTRTFESRSSSSSRTQRLLETFRGAVEAKSDSPAKIRPTPQELQRRAREDIRWIAGSMGKDVMLEDTISISMSQKQQLQSELEAVAAQSVIESKVEIDKVGAASQSPAHWTNKFRF
jgi:hypothetical protein